VAEPKGSSVDPFDTKFFVGAHGVVVPELGSAGRTDGEINWWFHHTLVRANWATVGHDYLPARILEIGQIRWKTVATWVRYEERHDPIIGGNGAKSIRGWAEPQAASTPVCALMNPGGKWSAHKGVGCVFVRELVCEWWIELCLVPLVMVGALIWGVESERVDGNHGVILPAELSVCWR
jgi:hypothetical protein